MVFYISLVVGNVPQANYQVYESKESLERFATFVEMFKTLTPYRKKLFKENSESGLPVTRPLFMHYETDPVCYAGEIQTDDAQINLI